MFWLILFMVICTTKEQDLPKLICLYGIFVVKNDTILCVLCVICLQGMEPGVKCICDVLYKADIELECLPCKIGHYSDVYGTDSCKKCKVCLKYKEICGRETDSVCQINSTESIFQRQFTRKQNWKIYVRNIL